MRLATPIDVSYLDLALAEPPLWLDIGWFEVYSEPGRYLGLFHRLDPAMAWASHQRLGSRWRLVQYGPCPSPWCSHIGLTMRAWLNPMPGGRCDCRIVDRFQEGGGG